MRGGSYREVHALSHEGGLHCHHLIPRVCLEEVGIDPAEGPVIQMFGPDHARTGSWGFSRRAQAERARITDMLRRGDFDGALQAGIADVRANFGSRYDDAISQAEGYHATWRRPAGASRPMVGGGAGSSVGSGSAEGNISLLVQRLTSYVVALERHTAAIESARERVGESFAHLQTVWEGDGAQDFYRQFGGSLESIDAYLAGARSIRLLLEERLAALREADRPGL